MKYIVCPECGKSYPKDCITDVPVCPDCGASAENKVVKIKNVEPLKKCFVVGTFLLWLIAVFVFSLFAFVGFSCKIYSAGFLCIIFALAFLVAGFFSSTKYQVGACPYCKSDIFLKKSDETNVLCRSCYRGVVKTADTLETDLERSFEFSKNLADTSISTIEALRSSNNLALLSETFSNQNEVDDRIISIMIEKFAANGWDLWDSSIHRADGQVERIKRGIKPYNGILLVQYDPSAEIAKMLGTSGEYYLVSKQRCSCPDFKKRQRPCKHMYYLCSTLPDYGEHLATDSVTPLSGEQDMTLYGLTFTIAGRNQAPVKRFIMNHGGKFIDTYSWEKVSALIVLNDVFTNKRIELQSRNIETLTFEELKNLFHFYREDDT